MKSRCCRNAKWELCQGPRFKLSCQFFLVCLLVSLYNIWVVWFKSGSNSERVVKDFNFAQSGRVMADAMHGYDIPFGTDIKVVQ